MNKDNNRLIVFLKRNGFKKMEPSHYANEMCGVVLDGDKIAIADNSGNEEYINKDYFTLLGYLVTKGYMSRFFKH